MVSVWILMCIFISSWAEKWQNDLCSCWRQPLGGFAIFFYCYCFVAYFRKPSCCKRVNYLASFLRMKEWVCVAKTKKNDQKSRVVFSHDLVLFAAWIFWPLFWAKNKSWESKSSQKSYKTWFQSEFWTTFLFFCAQESGKTIYYPS